MIRIGIAGTGRMGQALVRAVAGDESSQLTAIWSRKASAPDGVSADVLVSDQIDEVLEAVDVLIDFSLPAGTEAVVAANRGRHVPLVSGVSGLSDAQMDAVRELGTSAPVFYDRNMSVGVAVLTDLARRATGALGDGFDIHIEETHHVHKIDAPSGTALKLGEAVAAAAKMDAAALNYEVERRGEVPGDHSVVFSGQYETLTLSHSVSNRDLFAAGALRAAHWLLDRPPGLYQMSDLVASA